MSKNQINYQPNFAVSKDISIQSQVSEGLWEALPKLHKDKTAIFELLDFKTDPESGRRIVRTHFILPSTAVEDDGMMKKVNFIVARSFDGKETLGDVVFSSELDGRIYLNGAFPKDREVYAFMMLHQQNESTAGKPWHMGQAPYTFRLIDEEINAQRKIELRRLARDIQTQLDEMIIDELRELAKSTRIYVPNPQTKPILLEALYGHAEKEPENMQVAIDEMNPPDEGLVTAAVQADIVRYDETDRSWKWVEKDHSLGAKIVGVRVGMTPVFSFASHLKSPKNLKTKEIILGVLKTNASK